LDVATEQVYSVDQGAHFARFVEAMRTAWAAGQDASLPVRARPLLEQLLQESPPDEAWVASLLRDRPPARELYRDPDFGFIQMGHFHGTERVQLDAEHGLTPHDHGPCWVLYGVYSGEIEITKYRRADDGAEPGKARLEVVDVVRVTPGTVQPYVAGEIHATRAISPQGSIVMSFLSGDLDKVERYRYELATGIVHKL
jgi:hypothetical protein